MIPPTVEKFSAPIIAKIQLPTLPVCSLVWRLRSDYQTYASLSSEMSRTRRNIQQIVHKAKERGLVTIKYLGNGRGNIATIHLTDSGRLLADLLRSMQRVRP